MGLNDYIQVGSKIKQLRKERGFSQRQVAVELGLPFSTYSNYENNNREPSFAILKSIAKLLDVSVAQLIADDQLADEERYKFQKMRDYLDEIGITLDRDEKDEEYDRYQLTTCDGGTVGIMSSGDLIDLYERITTDAENYIIRRLRVEFEENNERGS